ncbi:B3 domain-containing protein Os01g0234100-like isoform X2 [Triticum urartu]|uniref:TF-B3 domain-containing protein n=1 Tax=Triticum urartu TaxID=4572 RepID=A0A8R7PQ73_TRIUA|nr:B3 domain-containing protein Os01g0234100-like isoform X2 [Triticum urartu]
MSIDRSLKKKRGRPAGGGSPSVSKSERDKMVMEQKMALVHRRLALLDSEGDKEADVVPTATMDDRLAIVVDQQPVVVNGDDTDDEDEYVPLRIVRPRSVDSEQKRLLDVSQTHNAQDTGTAKKKRGRPVNAKIDMEQKLNMSTPGLGLVESGGSNSSKSDVDDDLVPMVAAVNCQKTCASVQGNFGSAMERAEEVLVKLPAEHPSFVKYMLHSHVVHGFWLGLPSDFCNKHLPKKDTAIVLEDEDGHNYDAKYLGAKQGLSAGWRGFAINHGIKVGDVVVFQLVSSAKFKVYILRANNFTTTDGALGLLCLEGGKEKIPKEESSNDVKSEAGKENIPKEESSNDVKSKAGKEKILKEESSNDVKSEAVKEKIPKEESSIDVKSEEKPKVAQSDSSNLASESITDGIKFSDTVIDFDNVKDFSSFSIVVDGLVIDCEFPDHLRETYYELCCAQKSFLHKELLKGLNLTLVVGAIMETIDIAEGIRACKARAPSCRDFVVWKKNLQALKLLGMNVDFLLKRVDDLLSLPARPRAPAEVKLERARTVAKIKAVESRISSVKDTLEEIDMEMEELESSVKIVDEMMQLLATAPW